MRALGSVLLAAPSFGLLLGGHRREPHLDALWAGKDDLPVEEWDSIHQYSKAGEEVQLVKKVGLGRPATAARDSVGRHKALQIVGMFDAGTNLFGALLEANIGAQQMQALCPGAVRPGYHCHWWKHMPPAALDLMLTTEMHLERALFVVAVVRSPLAQIGSWFEAPSSPLGGSCLQGATQGNFSWVDLKRACTIPENGEEFKGLADTWSTYMREYLKIKRWGSMLIVEYERLVLEPEKVIREVAEALGLPLPDWKFQKFQSLEPSPVMQGAALAETGGSHVAGGQMGAARQVVEAAHLSRWPATQFAMHLCWALDSRLTNQVSIPTVPPRNYSTECVF